MSKPKVAFLFPGQGSQYVGMGYDFYEKFPSAKEIFAKADEILECSFSKLIFEGPKEELTQTKNSQPAIYIVSWVIYQVLSQVCPSLTPYLCAGLSLGEYTALAATGRVSFEEGLRLVAKRAALMQEACVLSPGSMQVVLGMEESAIEAVLSKLPSVAASIANLNCPGQVVIAGTHEGLEVASGALKLAGAKRVLPLDVSGAFHSALMQSARDGLSPFLMNVTLKESPVLFVMNTPGDFVQDSSSIRANLISQVTEPVRWQAGIEAMVQEGVTHFIEIGCGKTLQGMNKRIGIKVPTYSLEKIEDLDGFLKAEEFFDVTT